MTQQVTQDAPVARKVLLRAEHLKKYYDIAGKGKLHAVDDVSFSIEEGKTLGLVGESGCGKSTVGNLLMRIQNQTSGEVWLEDKNLFAPKRRNLLELRKKMQIIFQDPYSSLNPKKTIRNILSEPFLIHKVCRGNELNQKIETLASMVGLEPYILDQYPHELDGGKRQMVGIARALSLNPKFIVCDEPVSALDVSVQATIINLLIDLQKKLGLTYLFISHDLSVVRHISDRVAVMYLGKIVEIADTDELFSHPMHPYALALLSAVPKITFSQRSNRILLNGDVPSPINPGAGCRFAPRCWMAKKHCQEEEPGLVQVKPGHCVACHYWEESGTRAESAVRMDNQ